MSVHYKYAYYDSEGKRRVKTFTASTLTKAKKLAKAWERTRPVEVIPKMSVLACVESYLAMKEAVLSPTTLRSYKSIKRNHFADIGMINIAALNKRDVQKWVSDLVADGLSAKTVRNCYALLRSAVAMHSEYINISAQLPMVVPYEAYCPSDGDIGRLVDQIRKKGDRDMLIATLLTAFGPLREGEVCAVTSKDVNGNVITINKSMAYTENHTWVTKTPKTLKSIRQLEYPDFVIEELKGIDGRLVKLTPHALYDRHRRLLKKLDIPYFRFHDLRHYGASILHAIGIPDIYVLHRGGWASDNVMKKVYRQVIPEEDKKQTELIVNHFSKFSQ